MRIPGVVLALGASMRLTRLVVADDIGKWWVKDPVDRAMTRYAEKAIEEAGPDGEPEQPWWWKYRSGLDCPFCIGFWIGTGVVAVDHLTKGTRMEGPVRIVGEMLALNEAAAHIGARLGDVADDE